MALRSIFSSSNQKSFENVPYVHDASSKNKIDDVQKMFQEIVKRKECDSGPSSSPPLKITKSSKDTSEPSLPRSHDIQLVMRGEQLCVQSKFLIKDEEVFAPFEQPPLKHQEFRPEKEKFLSSICFYVDMTYSKKLETSLEIICLMLDAIEKNQGATLSISTLAAFLPKKLKRLVGEQSFQVQSSPAEKNPEYTIDLPIGKEHPNYAFKDIFVLGMMLKTLFITNGKNQNVDKQLIQLITDITDKFSEMDFTKFSLVEHLRSIGRMLQDIAKSNRPPPSFHIVLQQKQTRASDFLCALFPWKTDQIYTFKNVCRFLSIEQKMIILDEIATKIFDILRVLSENEMQFYSPQNIGVCSSSADKQLHVSPITSIGSFTNSSDPNEVSRDPTAIQIQKFQMIATLLTEIFAGIDPNASELLRKIAVLRTFLTVPQHSSILTMDWVRSEIKRLRSTSN